MMKAKPCPSQTQGNGPQKEPEQDAREKQVPEKDRIRPTYPVNPCQVCPVSGSSGTRQRQTGAPGGPDSSVEKCGLIIGVGVAHIPPTSTLGPWR